MRTIEGTDIGTRAASLLAPGETVVFAARPAYVTVRVGSHWNATTLLLTERRLIVAKDRLFGRVKADFEVEWSDVRVVEGTLWKGGGPKIQLLVHTRRFEQPVELIVAPQYASDIESAIRSGYLDRPAT